MLGLHYRWQRIQARRAERARARGGPRVRVPPNVWWPAGHRVPRFVGLGVAAALVLTFTGPRAPAPPVPAPRRRSPSVAAAAKRLRHDMRRRLRRADAKHVRVLARHVGSRGCRAGKRRYVYAVAGRFPPDHDIFTVDAGSPYTVILRLVRLDPGWLMDHSTSRYVTIDVSVGTTPMRAVFMQPATGDRLVAVARHAYAFTLTGRTPCLPVT